MDEEEMKAAEEAAKKEAEAAAAAEAEEAARKAAEEEAEAEAARKAAEAGNGDDSAAALVAAQEELAALKEQLASFSGIDPAKAKKALEDLNAANKKARETEKAEAERKGEVERLKAMMAEDNQKVVDELNTQIGDLKGKLDGAVKTIQEMTVGAQFSSSKFIDEQLILTPSKTRALYGSHFSFEDGTVVAYDKPVGSDGATKLVDRQGKPLAFDVALEKIVSADSEFDRLKKSSLKAGAHSKTEDKTVKEKSEGVSSLDKIRQGLANLSK